MSSRLHSFLSLALGTVAALGTLSAAFGLVYPARGYGSKLPVLAALISGALLTCGALVLGLFAKRRAVQESEHFMARVALSVSGFFLFVVALGFGIPCLLLGAQD